jgi:hypothetical protein
MKGNTMFDASKAVQIDELSKKAVGRELSEESKTIGEWLINVRDSDTGKASYECESNEDAAKLAQKVTVQAVRIDVNTTLRFNAENRAILEVGVTAGPRKVTHRIKPDTTVELQDVTEDEALPSNEDEVSIVVDEAPAVVTTKVKGLNQAAVLAKARQAAK